MQYEFLVGEAPEVVDIVPQRDPIVISGRAVNFPANTGREGVTLEVWPVDAATGRRSSRRSAGHVRAPCRRLVRARSNSTPASTTSTS